MAAAARKLPVSAYFASAMSHRFCLAAPGDFISTPKITEFVALGAAGGCLPVLVIKGEPHNTLPYMRWLDWCSIAWVVNASRTRFGQMPEVVEKLRAVTAEEAAVKRAALRAVVDAFVWRPPAPLPVEQPSAADFLLADACDGARRFRGRGRGGGRGRGRGSGVANGTRAKLGRARLGKGRGRRLEEPKQDRAASARAFIDVRRCML